jgi:hypothetical protein
LNNFLFKKEISKIQKLFKKYDQIISGIEYDMAKDKLFINNTGDLKLNYVKKYIFI